MLVMAVQPGERWTSYNTHRQNFSSSILLDFGFGVINYSLFKFEGHSDQVVQYSPSPTDT